jgi:hypothetical protein
MHMLWHVSIDAFEKFPNNMSGKNCSTPGKNQREWGMHQQVLQDMLQGTN